MLVTAAMSSKLYSRSARLRSSPGVCGPRSISRQRTAVSSRRRFRTVRMRCSYLGTRLREGADEVLVFERMQRLANLVLRQVERQGRGWSAGCRR